MSARWLARAAFGLVLASAAVLIGFADLSDLALVAVGAIAAPATGLAQQAVRITYHPDTASYSILISI